MAASVETLFIVDHPRLFAGVRHQNMTLDSAFTDEVALQAHLEELLGADIKRLKVKKVDLVSDTTSVDVRFRLPEGRRAT